MIRRLFLSLLLISQCSVGVLGARAAEITTLAAAHLLPLHVATAEMLDQHAPRQISQDAIFDLPDADSVRPRKLAPMQHPAVFMPAPVPDLLQLCLTADHAAPLADVAALKQKAGKRITSAKPKAAKNAA
ncbi:MAG: hypothetical protein COW18_05380 [Zetaproteobacteria bacterium CG12_big_fil_rev_8_21_14_0_65_54_13]|nr:MAG: hypothetical protein COW18_05380 [Zetaproteobacteria bacterium CG12_big_fil_rev_8_21_14_0_65_54_13]PIX54598.1 MAG: hypothetical protein COZ50_07160 [Zetaproteobacteria bacterium CG_4_10_14_3_um_filter_54_28]PJA26828.1 MAG: hypothetical protein CO188_13670 [Zetaproteobacteria bacterium CG_4_9_14_3_um_filter_54_145]